MECCCNNHPPFAMTRAVGSKPETSYPCRRSSRRSPPHEKVVTHGPATLIEIVRDARFGILRRVCWKQRAHANGQLVLPPQSQGIFLIGEIAGVDNASQTEAVRVRIQFRSSAQPVIRSLQSLQRIDCGGGRTHNAAGFIDIDPFAGEKTFGRDYS